MVHILGVHRWLRILTRISRGFPPVQKQSSSIDSRVELFGDTHLAD